MDLPPTYASLFPNPPSYSSLFPKKTWWNKLFPKSDARTPVINKTQKNNTFNISNWFKKEHHPNETLPQPVINILKQWVSLPQPTQLPIFFSNFLPPWKGKIIFFIIIHFYIF